MIGIYPYNPVFSFPHFLNQIARGTAWRINIGFEKINIHSIIYIQSVDRAEPDESFIIAAYRQNRAIG
jgi:hypothetical protein